MLSTRCIAVGICLLSLGGYVSAELEKAGEVTEVLGALVHSGDACEACAHAYPHCIITLASKPCGYLKSSDHLCLDLNSASHTIPLWCLCVMLCVAAVWEAESSGYCVSLITGHTNPLPFSSPFVPKSSITDHANRRTPC